MFNLSGDNPQSRIRLIRRLLRMLSEESRDESIVTVEQGGTNRVNIRDSV